LKARDQEFAEGLEVSEKRDGVVVIQDIGLDPWIFPRQPLQVFDKIRIPQEAHVKHQVSLIRDPELKTEGQQRDGQAAVLIPLQIMSREQVLEFVNREVRRIDDSICPTLELEQSFPLELNALQHRRLRQERMRPARFRESADEDFVSGLEKEELDRDIEGSHTIQVREQIGKESALADIDSERHVPDLPFALNTEFRKFGKQRGRQVVHAKESQIFKALDRVSFA
jgi:hypothetical protein